MEKIDKSIKTGADIGDLAINDGLFDLFVRITGARFGAAIGVPVIPASGVHIGFAEQGGNVGITRIFVMELAHGIKKGEIPFTAVRGCRLVVEHKHCLDQILLSGRTVGRQLAGLLNCRQTSTLRIIRQLHVAAIRIGPGAMGDTEIGHGAIGIEACCLLVGGD